MMILVISHLFVNRHVTLSVLIVTELIQYQLEGDILSSVLLGVGRAMATSSNRYDKSINDVSLSDPKMLTPQEVQPQNTSTLGVVLLIIQLIALTLLIPMAFVLVSFYRRVERQRRRDNMESHSVVVNAPGTNDEHSLDNENSPLTTSTFDDADNGQDTCRV